jgi:hypothetical protein
MMDEIRPLDAWSEVLDCLASEEVGLSSATNGEQSGAPDRHQLDSQVVEPDFCTQPICQIKGGKGRLVLSQSQVETGQRAKMLTLEGPIAAPGQGFEAFLQQTSRLVGSTPAHGHTGLNLHALSFSNPITDVREVLHRPARIGKRPIVVAEQGVSCRGSVGEHHRLAS